MKENLTTHVLGGGDYLESILLSIKKLLGITEEYDCFDADIIMNINSALSILTQMGVGPEEGFMIEDETASWDEFVEDIKLVNLVKSYIHLKVKLLFDPPQSSAVSNAIDAQLKELEWRISVSVEPSSK